MGQVKLSFPSSCVLIAENAVVRADKLAWPDCSPRKKWIEVENGTAGWNVNWPQRYTTLLVTAEYRCGAE